MNDNTPEQQAHEEHLNALADRFTIMCAHKWRERGLPVKALASAFVAWGLSEASQDATPTEVAEGLQRIADEIMEGEPTAPRHLI